MIQWLFTYIATSPWASGGTLAELCLEAIPASHDSHNTAFSKHQQAVLAFYAKDP